MILCSTKNFERVLQLRESIFKFLTLRVYFPFCKAVYAGKGEPISFQTLIDMPDRSLGKEASVFLTHYHLEPMPGYEAHDLKHTLLGFPACMKGEICMQYFEFGNGNRSIPVITVMFFGTLFMPEEFPAFLHQFNRGRKALPLSQIDLKNFITQPIDQLKQLWKL